MNFDVAVTTWVPERGGPRSHRIVLGGRYFDSCLEFHPALHVGYASQRKRRTNTTVLPDLGTAKL